MPDSQELYDDAMLDFSRGDFARAAEKLEKILQQEPAHFDAQLSLGMAYYRLGDWARAIAEGHKAEQLRPKEPLVHTNLSIFYQKKGDKPKAEHHAMQARIASWRDQIASPTASQENPELKLQTPPNPPKASVQFPEMPWKNKPKVGGKKA